MRSHAKVLAILCAVLAVGSAAAASGEAPGAGGATQGASADTLRTNLWLTRSLLSEIAQAAAEALPPPPAGVMLAPGDSSGATTLLTEQAFALLTDLGYVLYGAAAGADSLGAPAGAAAPSAGVDAVLGYRVLGVQLQYPKVGRTLGLWKRWIDRSLTVTAQLDIREAQSGRILLRQTLERSLADRLEAGDLLAVQSPLYPFTSTQAAEGAGRRRLETVVVLGALAGLVAVYFANTTN